jgi:hypothetical protein
VTARTAAARPAASSAAVGGGVAGRRGVLLRPELGHELGVLGAQPRSASARSTTARSDASSSLLVTALAARRPNTLRTTTTASYESPAVRHLVDGEARVAARRLWMVTRVSSALAKPSSFFASASQSSRDSRRAAGAAGWRSDRGAAGSGSPCGPVRVSALMPCAPC